MPLLVYDKVGESVRGYFHETTEEQVQMSVSGEFLCIQRHTVIHYRVDEPDWNNIDMAIIMSAKYKNHYTKTINLLNISAGHVSS